MKLIYVYIRKSPNLNEINLDRKTKFFIQKNQNLTINIKRDSGDYVESFKKIL